MTSNNTNGAIAAATQRQMEQSAAPSKSSIMNGIVNAESTKKLLANTLKENAGSFAASVIDLYNTDTNLQRCDPKQVFGECLKAASLKLPINKQLGFAYIVPYKGVPQFQLGYKGMIQLAMRTGAYKHINAGLVYEGEFLGENKLTGSIDLGGTRTGDDITGYFAYIETTNGFTKAYYWTRERVIAHAQRYSRSYQSGNAIWRDNFHEMAMKTVLRNLLSKWGIMSVEMISAVTDDVPQGVSDIPIDDAIPAEYEPGVTDETGTEANNGKL